MCCSEICNCSVVALFENIFIVKMRQYFILNVAVTSWLWIGSSSRDKDLVTGCFIKENNGRTSIGDHSRVRGMENNGRAQGTVDHSGLGIWKTKVEKVGEDQGGAGGPEEQGHAARDPRWKRRIGGSRWIREIGRKGGAGRNEDNNRAKVM